MEPPFNVKIHECRCCGLAQPNTKMKEVTHMLYLDLDLFAVTSALLIADLFTYCTKQQVDMDDQMPKQVCCSCVRQLIVTYEFLKKCENGLLSLVSRRALVENPALQDMQQDLYDPVEKALGETRDGSTKRQALLLESAVRPDSVIAIINERSPTESLDREKSIDESWNRFSNQQAPIEDAVLEVPVVLVPNELPYSEHSADENISDVSWENLKPTTENDPTLRLTNSRVNCKFCGASVKYIRYMSHYEREHKLELRDNTPAAETLVECRVCNKDLEFGKYKAHYIGLNHAQRAAPKLNTGYVPCPVCSMSFWIGSIEDHVRRHPNVVRNFMCHRTNCGEKFFVEKSLRWHHKRDHRADVGKKEPLSTENTCQICDLKFETKKKYLAHVMAHKQKMGKVCAVCGAIIQSKSMVAHLRTHSGEKPYACSVCDKRFCASSAMRVHEKLHLTQKPFPCIHCDKSFVRDIQLREHMRLHTNERPYECHICDKNYRKRTLLVNHLRLHTTEKPFACDHCPRRFHTKVLLTDHKYSHNPKGFECDKCDQKYTYPKLLKKHMREAHADDTRVEHLTVDYNVDHRLEDEMGWDRIDDSEVLRLDSMPSDIF